MKKVSIFDALKKSGWFSSFSGLLPLFMLAHFGHHLINSLPVPLLPMIRRDFGLDYTQSGLLISAFTLSYGLSQIPAGWLADRVGPRVLITIGICGVALAGMMAGLSQSYLGIILFLVAMGVAGGGYHPAAPPLISAAVDPKDLGKAMGLHMAGGSAPYFLAPLIAAVIATVWGWRGTLIALSIPTMLFGIVFYVVLGRLLNATKTEYKTNTLHDQSRQQPKGSLKKLVPFIVISTFTHALTFCVVAFIPLFLIDQFGLGEKSAAAFLSIFFSAGLWASLSGGILSDRLGAAPVVLAVCLASGPIIYLLNLAPSALGIGCLLFFLGICNYVRTPVAESYIVEQTTAHHRSTVLGIYYFSNIEGGGVLTPLMGFLIDAYGFYFSFTVAGATLVCLSLLCMIWMWRARVTKCSTVLGPTAGPSGEKR
jgi:predicted MFS family arabinose efflux permease